MTSEENAPLLSYLLSNLSSHRNGQVVMMRGGRLGIVAPPKVTDYVTTAVGAWTVQSIADTFTSKLNEGLKPIGAPD